MQNSPMHAKNIMPAISEMIRVIVLLFSSEGYSTGVPSLQTAVSYPVLPISSL